MKQCFACKVQKPLSDFRLRKGVNGTYPISYCKDCDNEYHRKSRMKNYWANAGRERNKAIERYWSNHEEALAMRKKGRDKLRMEVLIAYSGNPPKCACCSETNLIFLVTDHINGGGNQHRLAIKGYKTVSIYAWLRKNNYPAGFQILCHNCNFAKSHGGCPH